MVFPWRFGERWGNNRKAAKREVFEEVGIEDVNIITPHIGRFEGITAPTFVNTEHIYLDEEGECQYHYLLASIGNY